MNEVREIKAGTYFYCGTSLMMTVRKHGMYWSSVEATGNIEEDKMLMPIGVSFSEEYIRKYIKPEENVL